MVENTTKLYPGLTIQFGLENPLTIANALNLNSSFMKSQMELKSLAREGGKKLRDKEERELIVEHM